MKQIILILLVALGMSAQAQNYVKPTRPTHIESKWGMHITMQSTYPVNKYVDVNVEPKSTKLHTFIKPVTHDELIDYTDEQIKYLEKNNTRCSFHKTVIIHSLQSPNNNLNIKDYQLDFDRWDVGPALRVKIIK